jgi:integrase
MAIEKKGNGYRFRVYYTDLDGTRKQYNSKTYETKTLCKEKEAQFLLKKENPDKKNFHIVAMNFFEEYKEKRKVSSYESYIQCYNKHIYPYFSDLDINNINIQIVKNWVKIKEEEGFSTNYLNKLYNVLKNIFDYAIINYDLQTNYMQVIGRFQKNNKDVIKDEEKLRYITLDDFNKFISVTDDIKWKTFFIFLFYTGCRKGEVLALNWNDIDFINNEITINKTLYYKHKDGHINNTKTGVNRKIKISKTLKEQLILYLCNQKKYSDFSENWFVFGGPVFLAPSTIDRYKKKYFELANIKEITLHEFRHSHVSLLLNEYIKSGQTDYNKFMLMMSNRLGHSIDTMMRVYVHLLPTVQNEIVDLLDNL